MLNIKAKKNVAKGEINGDGGTLIQNSNVTVNKGMDEILELVHERHKQHTLEKLGLFQKCFGTMHPLYPDFKYNVNMNEKGVSIGLVASNAQSLIKHPIHGAIKFILPEKYKWAKNINELLKYGYEQQIPLNLKTKGFKMWLGDYLEEEQPEGDVRITPQKFPDPIPMKFEFQNTSFSLDYLMMGLTKIEDNYSIISNHKQENTKLILTLSINRSDISDCNLNVTISEKYKTNVQANLQISKFLFNISQEGIKKLVLLENDSEFMTFSKSNVNSPKVKKLENRIQLLERLNVLEKYYGVAFKLPKLLNKGAENNLLILEKSMNNQLISGTYSEIPVLITVNSNFDSNLLQSFNQDVGQKLDCVIKDEKIELFGQDIIFKEKIITYYNAILDNKEKTLKKFEFADNNDVINIRFIPLDSNSNQVDIHYNLK